MPAYSLLKQEQLQHKLVFIISEAKRKTRFDHCPVDPSLSVETFQFSNDLRWIGSVRFRKSSWAHHSSRLTETNAQRVLLSKRIRPMPDVEKSSKAKNDEMQQRMERQGVHHCNHLIKTSERPVQPMSKSLKKTTGQSPLSGSRVRPFC